MSKLYVSDKPLFPIDRATRLSKRKLTEVLIRARDGRTFSFAVKNGLLTLREVKDRI